MYSRELTNPKNIQEGTANHVQYIINLIESGEHGSALLQAVDLLDQLTTGHLQVSIKESEEISVDIPSGFIN